MIHLQKGDKVRCIGVRGVTVPAGTVYTFNRYHPSFSPDGSNSYRVIMYVEESTIPVFQDWFEYIEE